MQSALVCTARGGQCCPWMLLSLSLHVVIALWNYGKCCERGFSKSSSLFHWPKANLSLQPKQWIWHLVKAGDGFLTFAEMTLALRVKLKASLKESNTCGLGGLPPPAPSQGPSCFVWVFNFPCMSTSWSFLLLAVDNGVSYEEKLQNCSYGFQWLLTLSQASFL